MIEAAILFKLLQTSILDIYKVFGPLVCCLKGIIPFHWPSGPQIWELWVAYGVEMMPLCHGWGCHPFQSASHIHIRDIKIVWAHWYAFQRHTLAVEALHHYTSQVGPIFGTPGSHGEWKWCHCVMVEAAILFKVLLVSILDIQSVWAFGMLSQGMCAPSYHSTGQVGPRFGNSSVGHFTWSENEANTSCLVRLASTSDHFPIS